MRVDGVVVDPVALALRHTGEIELANGDDDVTLLAVDGVAVDVERVGEAVETADLLQLLERRRHTGRVLQADAGNRLSVVAQLPGADVGLGCVLLHLGVGDVVARAGRVDVALDVRRFAVGLARPDLELLHDAPGRRRR